MDTTAVVPLGRGGQLDFRLPDGLPYLIAEHDDGDRGLAITTAVRQAETEFVIVVEPDAALKPYDVRELEMVCWDAPATYPSLVFCDRRWKPKRAATAPPFCPNRLRKENFVGPSALIRREALLEAGGWDSAWGTWLRLGKLKEAPQAHYLIRTPPLGEPEPDIPVPDLKAGFYCQGTPATTYLRCQLPARYLPGYVQQYWPAQKRVRTRDANGRFSGTDIVFPRHQGAAIFQYPGDKARRLLMEHMRSQGVRTLVEVDDTYLAMDTDWAKRAGWTRKGDGVHSVERHRLIAAEADGVIVTTDHLARAYRKLTPHVYVCRNSLDPKDWPDPPEDDGILRVGWFASQSHRADGSLIAPALEWAAKQDGVEVWMMGAGADRAMHVGDDGAVEKVTGTVWPEFRNVTFRHIPPTNDLGAYRRHLTRLDVGLAPVRRTVSSDARSDLKMIEYAAAGAFPVLSKVPPYDGWQDGEHCRKVVTRKDFLNAVKDLVRNPDETKRLAREAREHVLATRTIQAEIPAWQEAVEP